MACVISLRTLCPQQGGGLEHSAGGTTLPGASLAVALGGSPGLSRPSLGQWPLARVPLQPPFVLSSLGLPDPVALRNLEDGRPAPYLPGPASQLCPPAAIKTQPFLPALIGPEGGWPCTSLSFCFSTLTASFPSDQLGHTSATQFCRCSI